MQNGSPGQNVQILAQAQDLSASQNKNAFSMLLLFRIQDLGETWLKRRIRYQHPQRHHRKSKTICIDHFVDQTETTIMKWQQHPFIRRSEISGTARLLLALPKLAE